MKREQGVLTMTDTQKGWTVFQAASLLYYGEPIVRDTASVESLVFEMDEVEFIYVPWTYVQGVRDRFAFHMYHWMYNAHYRQGIVEWFNQGASTNHPFY